ncbi:MAG: hypothetical protein QXL91_06840 [Candidatus Bathyarchaeia archaeon]
MIHWRVLKAEETLHIDTQKLRQKLIEWLEEIFNLACKIAKGEVQALEGKPVTLKMRRDWARVAGYTAQVIQSIAKGFDEKEIDDQLKELRRLIDEAKAKAGTGYVG